MDLNWDHHNDHHDDHLQIDYGSRKNKRKIVYNLKLIISTGHPTGEEGNDFVESFKNLRSFFSSKNVCFFKSFFGQTESVALFQNFCVQFFELFYKMS